MSLSRRIRRFTGYIFSEKPRVKSLQPNGSGLSAPSNLTATAVSNTEIDLAWTRVSTDETATYIERSLTLIGGYTQINALGAGQSSYADSTVSANTQYYYRVRVYNAAQGYSAYSNVATATTFNQQNTDYGDFVSIADGQAPWLFWLNDTYFGSNTGIVGVMISPDYGIISASAQEYLQSNYLDFEAVAGCMASTYAGAPYAQVIPVNGFSNNIAYDGYSGTYDVSVVQFQYGFTPNAYVDFAPYANLDESTYPISTTLARFGFFGFTSGVSTGLRSNMTSGVGVRVSVATANMIGAPHLPQILSTMLPCTPASGDVIGYFGTPLMASDGLGGNYLVGTANDYVSPFNYSLLPHSKIASNIDFIYGETGINPR